jgi:Kef-type K+ transport system membrane component KefB
MAFASAIATDAMGVHALFGAFVAGLVMPEAPAGQSGMVAPIETLTTALFLPLFFALTGLRTNLRLAAGPDALALAGLVLAAAIAGKGVASAIAARAMGLTWRSAWTMGALLNTRGLIELVILNIGLDAGLLSPTVVSIYVAMTFVTPLMTSPLLNVLVPDAEAVRSGPARVA